MAPSVHEACRHLLVRSSAASCRLGVPEPCPEGCLFLEERVVDDAGWVQAPTERMSNTADGLAGLPKPRKPKKRKRT